MYYASFMHVLVYVWYMGVCVMQVCMSLCMFLLSFSKIISTLLQAIFKVSCLSLKFYYFVLIFLKKII